jgi:fructose-1,6-bisphosphatase/inositol monophosphatase family enzyme
MSDTDLEQLAEVVTEALHRATRIHDDLGPAGVKEVRLSPVGEMSLECDIRCEEAVLNVLREAGLSATAYTEEHGIITLGTGKGLTITLDGLDGTSRYKIAPGRERYATMVAILQGDDPTYDDYLVCATKEHASGRMFRCTRGGRTVLEEGGVSKRLHVAPAVDLKDVALAYLDGYWLRNQQFYSRALTGLRTTYLNASCIYYEDMALGLAHLVLECTRKRNLEIACGYGLVREAGGVTVTPDGQSLGRQRYRSFAQLNAEGDVHIPVLTACSRELALQVLERIRGQLPANDWAALTSGCRERPGR